MHQFVSVYEMGKEKPVFSQPIHRGFVTAVAWEPNGNRIASGSYDGTIRISDIKDIYGRQTEVLSGHRGNVNAVAWVMVPLGTGIKKVLFSCAGDGTLRAWSGDNVKPELLCRGLGWISQARWNPNGSRVAASTFNSDSLHRLRIFDPSVTDHRIIPVKNAMPFDLAWAPDGSKLAIAQKHIGTVRVIDAASGNELGTFDCERVLRVAWHPDGRYLAATSENEISILDTQSSGSLPVCTIPRLAGRVAWNRDGRRLAIGTFEGAIEIWDGVKGTFIVTLRSSTPPIPGEMRFENGSLREVQDIAWDPVGDRLAFVTEDTVAEVIDAHTGLIQQQFSGHTGAIRCLAWSPNGGRIATGGADGTVRLYSVETGDEVARIPHGTGFNEISALDWSRDGYSLASAGFDGYLMIWDARRGHDLDTAVLLNGQVENDPHNKRLVSEAARSCAKIGWASRARALVDQAQSLDESDKTITRLRDEVEASLSAAIEAKTASPLPNDEAHE
jgi:WD40 repeat protein